MTAKTAYLFEVIEKIGAPLLSAARAAPVEAGRPEAAVLAELLGLAVQTGVDLAAVMDVQDRDGDGESVRLALAGLGGQIIAEHVRTQKSLPAASDMKRAVNAFTTVLTFADNFNPAAGNTARLEALAADLPPADDTQVMMQCMQALTPLVMTISDYSFGRPERKMMQDVIDRLSRLAANLTLTLMPEAAVTDLKQTELVILRAMVPLYCEAHRQEKNRIQSMDEKTRTQLMADHEGQIPLETLWESFDRHLAVLRVLSQSLVGRFAVAPAAAGGKAPSRQAGMTAAVAGPVSAPAPIPVQDASVPPPVSAAPLPEIQAEAASAQAYNPMSFFRPGAQKSDEEEF